MPQFEVPVTAANEFDICQCSVIIFWYFSVVLFVYCFEHWTDYIPSSFKGYWWETHQIRSTLWKLRYRPVLEPSNPCPRYCSLSVWAGMVVHQGVIVHTVMRESPSITGTRCAGLQLRITGRTAWLLPLTSSPWARASEEGSCQGYASHYRSF